jgi:signal peptidase I
MPQPRRRLSTPIQHTRTRSARTREFLKGWAIPVLLVLSVRTVLGQTYHISSGSMEPTMLVGDWLVVSNLAYGPHIPFTDRALPGYDEPERGDIVVFKSVYQADEASIGNDPEPVLVKRLWGVGGDTLYMRNGALHVNGVAYDSPESEETRRTASDFAGPEFAWQSQYAVHGSRFGEPPAHASLDTWGPLLVPAGHLFMLGDNRHGSKDSRFWGMVPRGNVRGRPVVVYYSYNANDSDRFWPAITDIRWSRIGHVYR